MFSSVSFFAIQRGFREPSLHSRCFCLFVVFAGRQTSSSKSGNLLWLVSIRRIRWRSEGWITKGRWESSATAYDLAYYAPMFSLQRLRSRKSSVSRSCRCVFFAAGALVSFPFHRVLIFFSKLILSQGIYQKLKLPQHRCLQGTKMGLNDGREAFCVAFRFCPCGKDAARVRKQVA